MKTFSPFTTILLLISSLIFNYSSTETCYGAVPQGNCPDNMLLYLRFDEASCPHADYYGLHNTIVADCPVATTGKINGGQTFSDSTKVDIPDFSTEFDWESTASFSFEFWLKTTSSNTMICLARHRLDTEHTAYWYVGTEGVYAAFELRDNGNNLSIIKSTKAVNDGVWHHILAVRDGTNKLNVLYVDGIEEASAYVDYQYNFVADLPTEINVGYLHRSYDDEPEYHLLGSLDEIAIFNRAITAAEVIAFYNSGNPTGHCTSFYAPVITSSPITTATKDVTYSYTFTVTDMDAVDVLTLSAVTKPDWLNFNWTPGNKSAVLTGTPRSKNIGTTNVSLGVSDGYSYVDQSFSITVTGVNNIPVITGQNTLNINEDNIITLSKSDLLITDDDLPEDLTLQVLAGTHYSFENNNVTPDANYNGPLYVNVVVHDLVNQSNEYQVLITVNPINDSPEITSTPIETATINFHYRYSFTVVDVDENDVLTIEVPTKPDWLNFTAGSSGGFLYGIPRDSNIGSSPVVLNVTDGHSTVSQTFIISVTETSVMNTIDNDMISTVYPNPASNRILFKFALSDRVRLEIFDISGDLIKTIGSDNTDLIEVNISDMPNGIYLYKAYQLEEISYGKIVKN